MAPHGTVPPSACAPSTRTAACSPDCGEAVCLSVEGPLKILGPSVVPLRGGMAGTYLATTGEAGRAVLHCRMEGALDTEAVLTVRSREG